MLLKTTRLLTEGTVGGKQHSQVAKPTRKELDVTKLLDHLEQEDQQEDEHLNQEMNQADSSNQEIPEKSCVPSSLTPSVLGHLGEQGAWHEYTKRLHQISQQIAQEERKGWPHFSRVFMVSAKEGDGVWDLKVSPISINISISIYILLPSLVSIKLSTSDKYPSVQPCINQVEHINVL